MSASRALILKTVMFSIKMIRQDRAFVAGHRGRRRLTDCNRAGAVTAHYARGDRRATEKGMSVAISEPTDVRRAKSASEAGPTSSREEIPHSRGCPASPLAAMRFLEMQTIQLKHDERYHKDITLLNVGDRMKHMTLHMAKYAARFISPGSAGSGTALVDAFIIALASANALNLDLGRELAAAQSSTFEELGCHVATERSLDRGHTFNFVRLFAEAMGSMAKATESLDHMEAFPSREVLAASILKIAELVVGEAWARNLDLSSEMASRLDGV